MAEHEPHRARFDEQALADALNACSATVRDVAYGEGVQYSAGRGSVRLEIFPRTGVTRLTAPDVRVELFGGTRAEVSEGGVEFARAQPGQDASLTVVPDGGIVCTLVAGGEYRSPDATEPAADPLPRLVAAPETPAGLAPAPLPDRKAPGQSGSDVQTAEHDEPTEPEAVTMQSRLGRDPWFGGSEESPIAGFPLAINAANRTIWHKVVVFDETATKLAAQLQRGDVRKGRLVEVTGQLVVREDPTPKGVRKSEEFHATAVSGVKPARPQSPSPGAR